MTEFIHNTWWLYKFRTSILHLLERFTSCVLRVCCLVICVLLSTSRCYAVVGRSGLGGPKHFELPNVMNKLNHKTLCILLRYIYICGDNFEKGSGNEIPP